MRPGFHQGISDAEFDRRVYQREFEAILGYGTTWFREQEKRGVIPQGQRDRGGKRKWWHASEVRRTLEKIDVDRNQAAARSATWGPPRKEG
jgi:hypothetical protein